MRRVERDTHRSRNLVGGEMKVMRTLWGAPTSEGKPERSSRFWGCSGQEGGGGWGGGNT